MRAFQVLVSVTRERKISLVARDLEQARLAVRDLLAAGETIKRVDQLGEARSGRAGEALRHLLGCDYLDLHGLAASVEGWLRAAVAADDATRRVLNARLAMAGLRVTDGPNIVIGSAGSVPTLALWFQNTDWQGPDLISTLRTLPEAQTRVFSFAGINSKAVILPAAVVLEGGAA